MTTFVVIIPEETLRSFIHPALDLQTGQLVELDTEPVPEQLDLGLDTEVAGLAPEPGH
jgi:hypothetical protein